MHDHENTARQWERKTEIGQGQDHGKDTGRMAVRMTKKKRGIMMLWEDWAGLE